MTVKMKFVSIKYYETEPNTSKSLLQAYSEQRQTEVKFPRIEYVADAQAKDISRFLKNFFFQYVQYWKIGNTRTEAFSELKETKH